MVTGTDYPPNWVILPGSSLTAELVMRDWTKKPIIEICGNLKGLVSLGNLLLWVSLHSADTESLSITDLPFIHVKSALSLTVVQPMHGSDSYGKLVRVDKDQQFQWLVKDDVLERAAISILDTGYTPEEYGPHAHGYIDPDSEYELFFCKR